MAVFIGATNSKKPTVFKVGKPFKEGKVWGQKIVEIIDGKNHYATTYAYKKADLTSAFRSYTTYNGN